MICPVPELPVPVELPLALVPLELEEPLVSDWGVTCVALENAEADGVIELPILLLLFPKLLCACDSVWP
ncbi:hypothetical protein LOC68_01120 [Blastopirellula sp. JC732]|uniref:Uncharacterized protein n=1 Tax=Blastopirellula sediminis TaxID=2894196 RepID=A0A9X1SDR7_9BACT|nr:hypothetical protein [Blastopirellula sediminis]MCC9608212.1 hypothetical protein [Blastopirellula sediminis]MCC9626995.1 hypothetical protein [Blastopirellula sediminis]